MGYNFVGEWECQMKMHCDLQGLCKRALMCSKQMRLRLPLDRLRDQLVHFLKVKLLELASLWIEYAVRQPVNSFHNELVYFWRVRIDVSVGKNAEPKLFARVIYGSYLAKFCSVSSPVEFVSVSNKTKLENLWSSNFSSLVHGRCVNFCTAFSYFSCFVFVMWTA